MATSLENVKLAIVDGDCGHLPVNALPVVVWRSQRQAAFGRGRTPAGGPPLALGSPCAPNPVRLACVTSARGLSLPPQATKQVAIS